MLSQEEEHILNFKGYDKQVLVDWYLQNEHKFPRLLKSGSDFERQMDRSALFANNLITQNKDNINRLRNNPKLNKSLGTPLFYFDNMAFVIAIFEDSYISVKAVKGQKANALFSVGMNIDIVEWSKIPKKLLLNPGILLNNSGQDSAELIVGAFGGAENIVNCVMSFRDHLIADLKNKRELDIKEGKENLKKQESLNLKLLDLIKETYDKDGNGIIDISESHNQLELLLKENKQFIQSNHPEHIKDFVKIIAYLKKSQSNLQTLYSELTSDENLFETSQNFSFLETAIESHQLVSFNSMYLLNSLLDEDLFTFYEIREKFDTLRVFHSTYQNDVSQQLNQVNRNLSNIMVQLEVLNTNCLEIVDGLNDLNWATSEMHESLETKLNSINQGIGFQNIIGIYNAHKLKKINNKLS